MSASNTDTNIETQVQVQVQVQPKPSRTLKRIAPTLITTTLLKKEKTLDELCESSWNAEMENVEIKGEEQIKRLKQEHYRDVYRCHVGQCERGITALDVKIDKMERRIRTLRAILDAAKNYIL